MRNGSLRLVAVLLLSSTLAEVGCSSDPDSAPADTQDNSETATGSARSTEAAPAGSCTRLAGGTAVTDLCGAALLNSLTGAEAMQLCSDTSAYVAGSITRATGCKYAGIIAAASNSSPTEAQLQASCAATERTCNQDDTVMRPGENTLCSQIPRTCTATVEQYSTCITDEALLFEQGASALISCSMLTFGNLSTAYTVPTAASEAPSCRAVKAACPTFSLPYIN
jgi:hypothetical protein